jgi:DNA-binding protein HU-beta
MNQSNLITAIQSAAISKREGQHISKADVEAILAALADITSAEMQTKNGEIPLPGLGKLKASTRAARTGRNPATGAEIDIPARKTVKFVASKALRDALE